MGQGEWTKPDMENLVTQSLYSRERSVIHVCMFRCHDLAVAITPEVKPEIEDDLPSLLPVACLPVQHQPGK